MNCVSDWSTSDQRVKFESAAPRIFCNDELRLKAMFAE
jgi:hypothetical protein